MFKKKSLLLTALVVLTALFSLYLAPQHSSALSAVNYTSHIIDDAVYRNSGTMSDADIQAFLSSQGSGLAGFSAIENCGSPGSPNYTFYATYYACGQNASAAQIIGAASRAYGINPRVILATLQKEQSLVTTPNPSASQLNCAMGYLSCGGSDGFFQQVDDGAWQLRTNYELGSGNSWWGYSPASYPCNGATSLYNNALKAGRTVTFIDHGGTPYSTITLANMSTGSLYCYTPHVYNNPQGLYGNPQFGTTGQYYSGTYNFVKKFIEWWGTTYTSGFQAIYAGQSAHANVVRGNSTHAFVRYQNGGSQPWYDDVTAPAYGTYPVRLATTNPINVGNQFSAFWPARNRAASTFAAVYEADGTTLTSNQHVALPGQIVQYNFAFSVSSSTPTGVYQNYFQPVLDGSALWNMGGVARFELNIQPLIFQASFAGQSAYPTLVHGDTTAAHLRYRNSGNQPWYDDVTAPAYGTYPVHLATTNPINAPSALASGWPANSRPATTFGAVYQPDGVTLAADQHVVLPGQIVQFNFAFRGSVPGFHRQYFQPILEGSTLWNMGALSWLDVTVQPLTFNATFAGQSAYPTVGKGQTSAAYLRYKNTGNRPWYDAATASTYGTYPVHLAKTNPINSLSPFSATWQTTNRPALQFAAVYEADGVTLASDQHIAQPGQIVQFDFTFTIPADWPTGLNRHYFQPILEGSTLWNMGALSWLDVTVTD